MADYILQYVLEISGRVELEIERIHKPSIFKESLVAMKAACIKFFERTRYSVGLEYRLEHFLAGSLGEFRAIIGLHIARLACSFDIEVLGEFAAILPRETEWNCSPAFPGSPEIGNNRPKLLAAGKTTKKISSKKAAH